MRGLIRLAVSLVFCSVVATHCRADDKSEINALYAKMCTAMKSRKVDSMMALVTPDYTRTKINGKKLAYKEAEQDLRSQLGSATKVTVAEIKPSEMKFTGNTAFMWTDFEFSAEVVDKEGKMGAKGAKHIMSDSGKTREWLVKTPKGWRFQKSEILKENPTLDGQSTHRMGPGQRR